MKALLADAEWKPRPGYTPTERERRDKRAVMGSDLFCNPSLELVDIQEPTPKPDEVIIKVGGVAICGSDGMFLDSDADNYISYCGHCKLPVVLGHEFSGEIVEIGKYVKDFNVGDLIVAETMNWCGECMSCRTGLFNQCRNLEEIGFSLNGGYAEYLVAKSKFCFSVNELVDVYGSKNRTLEIAALVEPTAVAYNGLFTRGGGFAPGGNVAVFGAGPIGLSIISLAKAAGAAKVFSFEKKWDRIELAKKVGADYALNVNKLKNEGITPAQLVMEITKDVGVEMVLEATNEQQETMSDMEQMVAVGGTIVQLGLSRERIQIMSAFLQKKSVNYSCSIGSSGHGIWSNVIRLIAAKRIDPSLFLSECHSLDEVIETIRKSKLANGGKYVITPNW